LLPYPRPGAPVVPPRTPGRHGADRLPRLPLVADGLREKARHPGQLLRPAADLGLGDLARPQDAPPGQPGPLHPAVRGAVVSLAPDPGAVHRPSVLRRVAPPAPQRSLHRPAAIS